MPTTHLRDFWYVVARSRDLGRKPIGRRLMGQSLVVFRDRGGMARVLDAVCPHRGANLAEGRVVDGCVVCPYHGWGFDGAGRCTTIPAHRDGVIPKGFTTDSFPVLEQQGLVWTSLGRPVAPPPQFPVLDDRSLEVFCYEATAKVAFDWWVENALDFAHLPFIHPSTIGDDDATIEDFTIERRADDLGFVARATPRPDYSLASRLLKLDVRVTVELAMPGTTLFDFDLGKGRRQVILAFATPESDDTSAPSLRVCNFSLRNFLRVPLGNAIGRLFLRRVVQEDLGIGERSLAPISLDRTRMFSTRADELSLEFLRLARLWRAREQRQFAAKQ
jgi:phenylpropionate dioxygenase-like ring-hydroxylating dioxygenase large terminal subunit